MGGSEGERGGRLVALGDSFSCGVGVGIQLSAAETWVGLLADALDLELEVLAAPGRASAEVLREQVPTATARPGELATVLVGLNDVVRAAFPREATDASVHGIVGELCAAYPLVLVAQLHNAVALLPLPAAMRRRYVQRIAAVNAALAAAVAAHERAVLLDLSAVPALSGRCGWAVDRIHPSRYGHQVIADAAVAAVRQRGVARVGQAGPDVTALPERPPTLRDEIGWFVGFGAPWLVRRLPKVVLGGSNQAARFTRRGPIDSGTVEPVAGRGVSRGE
jgi:lysophospholipase L1-like esterase